MTQGLFSVSEAQHEELVTGGDAYGAEGVVEDVTAVAEVDLSRAKETVQESTQEVSDTVKNTANSEDGKRSVMASAVGGVIVAFAFAVINWVIR